MRPPREIGRSGGRDSSPDARKAAYGGPVLRCGRRLREVTAMACKTGAEHLRSLQDGRTVYLDGKLVGDVTTHPAYRNAGASAARLYDYQARPENIELMTFLPDGGTRRVSRCWQMPRSYAELVQRRQALQAWAALSYGFMGRSPDHVASTCIGQLMGLEVFA